MDLKQGLLRVGRLKNGTPSNHRIRGPEIRALRRLRRDYPGSRYVFVTERKAPLTAATVRKMIARSGQRVGLLFLVHPHMLRRACATSSPTTDTTHERFSTTWDTGTSRIRPDTLSWHRIGSARSGGIKAALQGLSFTKNRSRGLMSYFSISSFSRLWTAASTLARIGPSRISLLRFAINAGSAPSICC